MELGIKKKIKNFTYGYASAIAHKLFGEPNFNKGKLLKILPPAPIILEIGASIGIDTVQFREIFPKAIIHAFEPEPSNFNKLVKRTKGLGIHCHQIALGSINDKSRFFVSSGASHADSSSLKKPTGHITVFPQIKFKKVIEVSVRRLEDFLDSNSIDHVDFLWMDTQGTELEILKNSGKVLDSVKAIHIEVFLSELYENSPLYDEVRQFLEEKGFSVFEEMKMLEKYKNVVFLKKV